MVLAQLQGKGERSGLTLKTLKQSRVSQSQEAKYGNPPIHFSQ
jgi:hypothetical protein